MTEQLPKKIVDTLESGTRTRTTHTTFLPDDQSLEQQTREDRENTLNGYRREGFRVIETKEEGGTQ